MPKTLANITESYKRDYTKFTPQLEIKCCLKISFSSHGTDQKLRIGKDFACSIFNENPDDKLNKVINRIITFVKIENYYNYDYNNYYIYPEFKIQLK